MAELNNQHEIKETNQTTDDQLIDDEIDEQPIDEVEDEQPVDEQPVDEQPVDEQPVDEQPVDEQPVDEQPVDEQPIVEQIDEGANEEQNDDEAVDEQQNEENVNTNIVPIKFKCNLISFNNLIISIPLAILLIAFSLSFSSFIINEKSLESMCGHIKLNATDYKEAWNNCRYILYDNQHRIAKSHHFILYLIFGLASIYVSYASIFEYIKVSFGLNCIILILSALASNWDIMSNFYKMCFYGVGICILLYTGPYINERLSHED
jgi:hypothetical protein